MSKMTYQKVVDKMIQTWKDSGLISCECYLHSNKLISFRCEDRWFNLSYRRRLNIQTASEEVVIFNAMNRKPVVAIDLNTEYRDQAEFNAIFTHWVKTAHC